MSNLYNYTSTVCNVEITWHLDQKIRHFLSLLESSFFPPTVSRNSSDLILMSHKFLCLKENNAYFSVLLGLICTYRIVCNVNLWAQIHFLSPQIEIIINKPFLNR